MPEIEVRRPETLSELVRILFDLGPPQRHGHFRSEWIYRGMGNANWEVESTLQRLGNHAGIVELPLLRNFRRYADPTHNIDATSLWNDLAVGQHHGLPTRLVDWSNSPLVALHFAVGSTPDLEVESAIWMLSLRTINLLPLRLQEVLKLENAHAFTTRMLDKIATFEELDALRDEADFIVVFEPPALDQRITNQYAMFTALPDPLASVSSFLNRNPSYGQKIVIPSALKWEVRDKLDQSNFTERMLFPGLDGLASWLHRYYGPGVGPSHEGSSQSLWDSQSQPIMRRFGDREQHDKDPPG